MFTGVLGGGDKAPVHHIHTYIHTHKHICTGVHGGARWRRQGAGHNWRQDYYLRAFILQRFDHCDIHRQCGCLLDPASCYEGMYANVCACVCMYVYIYIYIYIYILRMLFLYVWIIATYTGSVAAFLTQQAAMKVCMPMCVCVCDVSYVSILRLCSSFLTQQAVMKVCMPMCVCVCERECVCLSYVSVLRPCS